MPPTRIADIVVPQVFNRYVQVRTAELSALQQSGIIVNAPELDVLATSGGKTVNMPFWNDLVGEDEILSDTTALTPQNVTAGQDVAALLARGKAFAVNDLAAAFAGDDPVGVIVDRFAAFWARARQRVLVSSLKGVFASASMAGLVHDISGAVGAASNIGATGFIDATQKLGDAKDNLSGVMMHSAVEAFLAKQDLIEYEKDSEGNVRVRRYMGHDVIVDDALAASGGIFDTYLFGPGAFGLGNGRPKYPVESDRDTLSGDDIEINRQHYILHPRGVRFNAASVAGATPSNAELAMEANWTRVYDTKLIRMVRFRHKIDQTG